MDILLYYLLFSVSFNLLLFLIAYLLQTDKLTDISYSLTFIAMAIFSLWDSAQSIVDWLLTLLVVIWGIRLGGYLLYRISRIGRDQRFDEIRINFVSFLLFWLMQGLTCFLVLLPVLLAQRTESKEAGFLLILGSLLAVLGLMIEAVADAQKFRFKQRNPKTFMRSGLWSIVQHPNYSGELLFWWAIWIASIPFTSWYFSIIGPLWISFIIIRFSGISILQEKWLEKYGDDPEFQNYHQQTYKLLPFVY